MVRYIFDLRLQGYGFRKIALRLNAEKVPAPRTFYYMAEGRENLRGETPYMMQDYAQLEELDRPTLVRMIEKIVIGDRYTVDDHEERDIHIYYNFVGYIEVEE